MVGCDVGHYFLRLGLGLAARTNSRLLTIISPASVRYNLLAHSRRPRPLAIPIPIRYYRTCYLVLSTCPPLIARRSSLVIATYSDIQLVLSVVGTHTYIFVIVVLLALLCQSRYVIDFWVFLGSACVV